MANLLLDDVLETLKCSNCLKYLSIRPVKVYPNRDIKCGRCCDENDNGRTSFYETVIVNSLFKCVNRYEGCNVVLTCDDMEKHEIYCESGSYNCVLCPQFTVCAYDFLEHFHTWHAENILNKPNIIVHKLKNEEQRYLYIINDYIFIFSINVDTLKETIILQCINVGPERRATDVRYYFKIMDEDKALFSTIPKSCLPNFKAENNNLVDFSSLDTDKNNLEISLVLDFLNPISSIYIPVNNIEENTPNEKIATKEVAETQNDDLSVVQTLKKKYWSDQMPNLYLMNDIIKRYSDLNIKISESGSAIEFYYDKKHIRYEMHCSNCEEYCIPKYWTITDWDFCKIFCCQDCYAYVKNFYELTPVDVVLYKILSLSLISKCHYNCGKNYPSADIIKHQIACLNRPSIDCPNIICGWRGNIHDLQVHITTHKSILHLDNKLTIAPNQTSLYYLYHEKEGFIVAHFLNNGQNTSSSFSNYQSKLNGTFNILGFSPNFFKSKLKLQNANTVIEALTDSFDITDYNQTIRVILSEKQSTSDTNNDGKLSVLCSDKYCLCKQYLSSECLKFNIDKELYEKYPELNLKISKCGGYIKFNHKTNVIRFGMHCSNCKEFQPPTHWTISDWESRKIFICKLCYPYVNSHELSPIDATFSEILRSLMFFCRWNCGKSFRFFRFSDIIFSDIITHEAECDNKPKLNCPVWNCEFSSHIKQLRNHLKSNHTVEFSYSNILRLDTINKTHRGLFYMYDGNHMCAMFQHCLNFNILAVIPQHTYKLVLHVNNQIHSNSYWNIQNNFSPIWIILKEKQNTAVKELSSKTEPGIFFRI